MATKVLVIAEHKEGKIKKVTHELISQALRDGAEVATVIAATDTQSLAQELAQMGSKKVYTATGDAYKFYNNEIFARVVLEAVKTFQPQILLVGCTAQGKDLSPRIAAQLNIGLASDCVSIKISGDQLSGRRPVYSGKALAEIEFLGSGPKFASVRPNSFPVEKLTPGASADVTALNVSLDGIKTKVLEVTQAAGSKVDLTEASIIVSGGRSMKSSENFEILEKLSAVIPGSAVGASRAAVDAGYRPHSYQVGQTGKVVSPNLYIAFGISGAIQHLAGMRTSKIIVAVNKDPEAPIFQIADYGLVADLFEVAPLLTEELKAHSAKLG